MLLKLIKAQNGNEVLEVFFRRSLKPYKGIEINFRIPRDTMSETLDFGAAATN